MARAPIAVFVYRRPANTRRLLASLAANPEAADSEVHVFADGPRSDAEMAAIEETRRVVRACGLPRLSLVARDRNLGLARSVIDGVARACSEHGRVIVLEDDLVLSRTFLGYVNAALDRYAGDERVMHVSGYMYDLDLGLRGDALFLPFLSSWGWATWQRAWRHFDPSAAAARRVLAEPALRHRFDLGGVYGFSSMLEAQIAGRLDSWAIRWYLSLFDRGGLALFPSRSLVENDGVGPGAMHTAGDEHSRLFRSRPHDLVVREFPEPAVDDRALQRIRGLFARERSVPARIERRARRLWRRISGSGGG